tara:strand:- start:2102 stop:2398 length:297 start_codon:yes stop_codon:yes gene_type:complete
MPKTKTITSNQAAKEQKRIKDSKTQQLKIVYGRVFNSVDGKLILEDLQRQFGFRNGIEQSSHAQGISALDMVARDQMKQPVRHIFRMIDAEITTPQTK